ncbi:MAG TPA: hypothetical protein VEI97_00825 [bacterium]|nr:hypothetical protein [bacterium]
MSLSFPTPAPESRIRSWRSLLLTPQDRESSLNRSIARSFAPPEPRTALAARRRRQLMFLAVATVAAVAIPTLFGWSPVEFLAATRTTLASFMF